MTKLTPTYDYLRLFLLIGLVFRNKSNATQSCGRALVYHKKMKKITLWPLFCWILYFHGSAMTANSLTLDNYVWTNRLVILISNKKNTDLEVQVRRFFESHVCGIEDRNLKLFHLGTNEPAATQLQEATHSQTGLWLIGYDGSIKDFSEDEQLLNRLFQIIDEMPIRQGEMASTPACG